MTIESKATEPYFSVVLFIMLYKVVLTFEFMDEIISECKLLSGKLLWQCLLGRRMRHKPTYKKTEMNNFRGYHP